MKILAFADMHGSRKALKEVIKKAKEAELVICCGDLTIFEQYIKKWLKELNDLKIPVLIIPGNHENSRNLKKACSHFDNIIYISAQDGITESRPVESHLSSRELLSAHPCSPLVLSPLRG